MEFRLLEDHATGFLLHLVRVGAFLAVVPLFGRQRDSFFPRLVLSIALAMIFWWTDRRIVATPQGLAALGFLAGRECVVGFALGYALSLLTAMLASAGEIISTEMGFAMATSINPESGVDATVVAQFFQVFGFLLILQADVHHEALRLLGHTFAACPVGEPLLIEPLWNGIRTLVAGGIVMAVQYAFPVLAVMLLLTVGLVLLGRAVPSINLMEFSFTARVLLALFAAAWFLAEGTPFLLGAFADFLVVIRGMFPL